MLNHWINPIYEEPAEAVEALVGHRIVAITRNRPPRRDLGTLGTLGDLASLTLDNGTVVELIGHDGGCAYASGCYTLDELAALPEVDHIITAVEFNDDDVDDNDSLEMAGTYRVFIFAEDRRIQLASFEGWAGNGCWYGTGYLIRVRPHTTN